MEKRNVRFICIFSFCVIFIAAVSIFLVKNHNLKKKTFTVAFYDVEDSIETAIFSLIQDYCDNDETKVIFYNISKSEELSKQIKKNRINMIFAPAGYASKKTVAVSEKGASIDEQNLDGLFSSMRESVIYTDESIRAIPLIFDNLEINIEKSEFKMSGMQSIASWDDIEEFGSIQKTKTDFPFCFAGTDSVFLLDLLGALGEAFDGLDAYNSAAKILSREAQFSTFDAQETVNKLFINPDAPLPYSFNYLKKLVEKGYISPASEYLKNTDVNSYLQQRITNLIFTTLSTHRSYDVKAIDRFSTIYVPSQKRPEQRHFTATITYAMPVSTSKLEYSNNLINYLISTETQSKLSNMTGLAPVLANCPTPDHQADDARYWIAATSSPLAGLGHEAELNDEQKEQLGKAILDILF